ncbi:DUF2946 domain-containing protein [Massilia timonae]|uniref:DUF2946 domain-containing protein n=1 Tax=Massilia timonae CCUG 45783 TaxID=883126 RepID=K9DJR0_9BURK|nr:DUF2946 domain-containing protein [Massilia timonae]EKU84563.1 hypothetical protein HMPREF9710_00295 [Massilia timonae CCUG 45783]
MNAQRNRSIILWLAALAILWGMLAPSLASNLPAHQGKTWIDVCLSVGTRLVALDLDTDSAAGDEAVHPGMHCPACLAQDDLAIIAHPPGSLVLLDAPLERILRPHGPALRPASAFLSDHRSRAPPLAA